MRFNAIEALLKLDPNAQIGFRGSLAGGLKGEHKLGLNMERVAFDGDVAFKLDKTGQYRPYSGSQGYDADFFVVSDKLAQQFGNRTFITELNAENIHPSLPNVLNDFDASMRSNPLLSRMKPGFPEFRIWNQKSMMNKALTGDTQIYFLPRQE